MSLEANPKLDVFGKIKQQKKHIEYTWNIDDFCKVRDECLLGNAIYSPIFNTDVESRWQIKLFPKGEVDGNKEYISIYTFNRSGATIKAQIGYSVMDGAQELHLREGGYEEYKPDKSWGYSKYLHYNNDCVKLLANNNNNKLIIICKVDLDNTSCTESHENERQVHFQIRKYSNFEKLLNNNKFSDVILTVEGEKIHAHKSILAINCEVFAAMFEHNMAEKEQNVVEIKDISANVLKEMLRYIYVGKVNNIMDIAIDLLVAADRYLLESLKNMCEESLCENLSSSNVIEYLKFAEKHNALKLKAEAIQYVVSNAEKIINDPEVKSYENLDSRIIWEIFQKLVVQRVDKKAK